MRWHAVGPRGQSRNGKIRRLCRFSSPDTGNLHLKVFRTLISARRSISVASGSRRKDVTKCEQRRERGGSGQVASGRSLVGRDCD